MLQTAVHSTLHLSALVLKVLWILGWRTVMEFWLCTSTSALWIRRPYRAFCRSAQEFISKVRRLWTKHRALLLRAFSHAQLHPVAFRTGFRGTKATLISCLHEEDCSVPPLSCTASLSSSLSLLLSS